MLTSDPNMMWSFNREISMGYIVSADLLSSNSVKLMGSHVGTPCIVNFPDAVKANAFVNAVQTLMTDNVYRDSNLSSNPPPPFAKWKMDCYGKTLRLERNGIEVFFHNDPNFVELDEIAMRLGRIVSVMA